MRTIALLTLLLGLALGACAEKTPPPKNAEPARAADAMDPGTAPTDDSKEPARPAATGDAGVSQPSMAAPRPADMGAPASSDK